MLSFINKYSLKSQLQNSNCFYLYKRTRGKEKMGFIIFTARKLALTSRLNSLSLQQMFRSQRQLSLLREQLALQLAGDGNGENQKRLEALSTEESIIEQEIKAIESEMKKIQLELEATEKAEDKGIEGSVAHYGQS